MVQQLELSQQVSTIPFGHWGIYSGTGALQLYEPGPDGIRPIDRIPIKIWDPLRTVHITLNGHEIDKYKGFFSISSNVRGQRPVEEGRENPIAAESRKRVLQDITQGRDFSIPISVDDSLCDNPFSTNPRMIDLRGYKSATIVNRFPPYGRIVNPDIEQEMKKSLGGSRYQKIAKGVCLLSFPTQHSEQLEETPKDRISAMLLSLQRALDFTVAEARQLGYSQIPLYVFINTKEDAGRSLSWLHTQAYADLTEDGHGGVTESILQAFEDQRKNHGCELCRLGKELPTEEGRVVYKNRYFLLYVPYSQQRSFHLRFTPREHLENLPCDLSFINDLADVLFMGNYALTESGLKQGRYIAIRQRPIGYDSFFHVFGEIMPVEAVGTAEVMEDCRMNKFTPNDVANKLKAALN